MINDIKIKRNPFINKTQSWFFENINKLENFNHSQRIRTLGSYHVCIWPPPKIQLILKRGINQAVKKYGYISHWLKVGELGGAGEPSPCPTETTQLHL